MILALACDAKPNDTVSLGDGGYAFEAIHNMTIVGVSTRASADDASATVDIQDDGTDVITGVDASDADTPGTWKSVHMGGTNAPISVAAGSVIEIDYNSHAVGVGNNTVIYYLAGVAND